MPKLKLLVPHHLVHRVYYFGLSPLGCNKFISHLENMLKFFFLSWQLFFFFQNKSKNDGSIICRYMIKEVGDKQVRMPWTLSTLLIELLKKALLG